MDHNICEPAIVPQSGNDLAERNGVAVVWQSVQNMMQNDGWETQARPMTNVIEQIDHICSKVGFVGTAGVDICAEDLVEHSKPIGHFRRPKCTTVYPLRIGTPT